MPQMSPMLWSLLFVYFIVLFLIFNILNYFNFMATSPSMSPAKLLVSFKKSFIWKW